MLFGGQTSLIVVLLILQLSAEDAKPCIQPHLIGDQVPEGLVRVCGSTDVSVKPEAAKWLCIIKPLLPYFYAF